jgi:hypothetical protein
VKKTCTRLTISLALLFLSMTAAHAAPANNIVFTLNSREYSVNGATYQVDAEPYIQKARIFVPLRYLARALGLDEKNITWSEPDNTIEFNFTTTKIKVIIGDRHIYVDGERRLMDVAPVIVENRVYLPARWMAEALGYAVTWDEITKSIIINPVIDQPEREPIQEPDTVTPGAELYEERLLSSSEIFFPAVKDSNVYNAGIAAKYVNGTVLAPQAEFSFNKVVGIRTAGRGFITGENIFGDPEIGGGVCRTSTVIYQAARKAGFRIVERHSHTLPVRYAPAGSDATVVWGAKDLRFINTGANPVIIYSRLENKNGGGYRLYAEIREKVKLARIKIAVIKNEPGACIWNNMDKESFTGILKDNHTFISSDQLEQLLHLACDKKEFNGKLYCSFNLTGQIINFMEGNNKATINGTEFNLSGTPFRSGSKDQTLWIPLQDWAKITETQAVWVARPQPQVLFNLCSIPVEGGAESTAGRAAGEQTGTPEQPATTP